MQITLAPFTTPQALLVGIQLHLLTPTSGVTFWVDDTSMLATTTASYDQNGQLTAYSSRLVAATGYAYNGDGLRATSVVGGVTTKYAWDSQAGVPLLLADATNDYLYGPDGGVVEQVAKTGGTTSYLHPDRIGSVRVVTNTAGAGIGTASFDPYGNPIARTGTTTTFGYSGQYTDPTGLIYLRARYYDPSTGQFITIDPDVDQTRSPYGYVEGDPLNETDPSGLKFGWNPISDIREAASDTFNAVVSPDVSNWVAGFGDTVTFGGTKQIRRLFNYETTGCAADLSSVDPNSIFYKYGGYGGDIAQFFDAPAGVAAFLERKGLIKGGEIVFSKNFRVAPLGGSKPQRWQEFLPHYHRRIVDSAGNTVSGGGMDWHRPWQKGF